MLQHAFTHGTTNAVAAARMLRRQSDAPVIASCCVCWKLLMLVKTLRLMPSGYTWSFCVFAPELLMLSCPCSMDSKNSSLGAQAIDPDESMWSMDDDVSQHGDDMKVLLVHLMRPPLTESEMTYKRGAAGVHGQ